MKINVKNYGLFSGYGKQDTFFILILILFALFGFGVFANASSIVSLTFVDPAYYIPANTLSADLFTGIIDQPGNNRTLYPYYVYFAYDDDDHTKIGMSASPYFTSTPYGTDIFSSPLAVSTSFIYSGTGSYMLSQGYSAGNYILIITNKQSVELLTAYFTLDSNGLISFSPPPVSGLPACGSDDGLLLDSAPINLCDIGNADTPIFNGIRWDWNCSSGVVSEMCRAYSSTENPINGTCGVWDGLEFDTWPDESELCGISTSLIYPSMLETIESYTWTCSGFNGGTSSYCSAEKTTIPDFPILPIGSIDDCSGLGIPEIWICSLSNTLKSIFLPSAEKINELNETINKISGRFPFSYINSAIGISKEIKNNITEDSNLSLSILNSETSSFDLTNLPFVDYIKIFTTTLISFVFVFWLIKFIKNIF